MLMKEQLCNNNFHRKNKRIDADVQEKWYTECRTRRETFGAICCFCRVDPIRCDINIRIYTCANVLSSSGADDVENTLICLHIYCTLRRRGEVRDPSVCVFDSAISMRRFRMTHHRT